MSNLNLDQNAKQLENIIASAMDAIIAINRSQIIVLFNTAAEQMFNCPKEQALGRHIESFIPERFRPIHKQHVENFARSEITKRKMGGLLPEIFGLRTDGTEFPIEASISKSPDGDLLTVILRDISQRKQAEDLFRLAVNSSPNSLIMTDTEGKIILANSQTEKLFGYSREELFALPSIDTLLPYSVRPDHAMHRKRYEKKPETRAMGAGRDLFALRKDGKEIPVEIGLNPIQTPEGLRILSVIVDISQRKKYERERESLLTKEHEARNSAELANRLKDEFLTNLSHELRTPLTAILGWAEIISSHFGKEGALKIEDVRQGLMVIERNAKAQTQLIDDLLDISLIVTGKLQFIVHQPVDLMQIVKHSIETIRPLATVKNIHIKASFEYDSGLVSGDPTRLTQITWNILSNAVKFTNKGGQIYVKLEKVRDEMALSVQDTGRGISPSFLPHVFERFRQADGSITREHGGLGLGLSIVKQLVDLHGGTIEARSGGLNKGAEFIVRLPIMSESPERSPELGNMTSDQSLAKLKILVVEDETDTREMLKVILHMNGAQVVCVSSSAEALSKLKEFWPDVLLSDIQMPEEDGYALLRKIKNLPDFKKKRFPAIALTAHARNVDKIRALQEGFVTHMPKPIEPDELVAVIAGITKQMS